MGQAKSSLPIRRQKAGHGRSIAAFTLSSTALENLVNSILNGREEAQGPSGQCNKKLSLKVGCKRIQPNTIAPS